MLTRGGCHTQRLAVAFSDMLGASAAAYAASGLGQSLDHRPVQLTLPHLARKKAATSVASQQPDGCGTLSTSCASRACSALHAVASTSLPSEAAHAAHAVAHAGMQLLPFADAAARSAYLHSPWCKNKCHYCDFPVVAVGAAGLDGPAVQTRMQDYVDLLLAEMHAAPHVRQLDKVCCHSVGRDSIACTDCAVVFADVKHKIHHRSLSTAQCCTVL